MQAASTAEATFLPPIWAWDEPFRGRVRVYPTLTPFRCGQCRIRAPSVPRRCELRRPGLLIRGRPSLAPGDIGSCDGIPVTSPVRTLIDLTTELDILAVERAVNDADKRGLVDPEMLREVLGRFRGEPGVRPLRLLLDKLFFRLSDSDHQMIRVVGGQGTCD
jgi:hypothetical protein